MIGSNLQYEEQVQCCDENTQGYYIVTVFYTFVTQLVYNSIYRLNLMYDFSESVPWFPMKISDIDQFANRVLSYGAELDSDHPVRSYPAYCR